MDRPELPPEQARVLTALFEKSITTPQYYPMTVNAIVAAANQKSARNPVMSLTEGEVGRGLNALAEQRFVERTDTGGRVPKWRQSFKHRLLLDDACAAVLAVLVLRGPQTRSEIRSHAANLRGPADADGVDAALERLTEKDPPLVVELPRQPGQSQSRIAHCLSGEPDVTELAAAAPTRTPSASRDDLLARIEALEARVAALESDKPDSSA